MKKPTLSTPSCDELPPVVKTEDERHQFVVCTTVAILPNVFLDSISNSTIYQDSYLLRLPWGLMTIPDSDRRLFLRTKEFNFPALAAIDWTDPATIERLCDGIRAQRWTATN